MPKVSIIINCYNGEKFLAETLSSISAQTMSDYEIIFWDNCSTDKTPQITQSFDTRLRYYRSDTHTSLGEARNAALACVTTADYIAFIDSDDLWEPTKLEKQVDFLDNHPQHGMVFTNCMQNNMIKGTKKIIYSKNYGKDIGFLDFTYQYSYTLSSFMIRRAALDGLDHLFDNRLSYAEEFDLFIRIAYRWNSAYLPEVLTTYRIHPKMTTIKMSERISLEYDIVLNNLMKAIPNLEADFPLIATRLRYLRDYSKAKNLLLSGDSRQAHILLAPFWGYHLKLNICYLISFLPGIWAQKIIELLSSFSALGPFKNRKV